MIGRPPMRAILLRAVGRLAGALAAAGRDDHHGHRFGCGWIARGWLSSSIAEVYSADARECQPQPEMAANPIHLPIASAALYG